MAHKSKTQRAKAAVAKQNKKDRLEREEAAGIKPTASEGADAAAAKSEAKPAKQQAAAVAKKEDKPKKKSTKLQFFKDVRAEMKRVTWPTRTDVVRWSGVVVGALIFFGVYVAVLDNVIITPGLIALTSLGA